MDEIGFHFYCRRHSIVKNSMRFTRMSRGRNRVVQRQLRYCSFASGGQSKKTHPVETVAQPQNGTSILLSALAALACFSTAYQFFDKLRKYSSFFSHAFVYACTQQTGILHFTNVGLDKQKDLRYSKIIHPPGGGERWSYESKI